jgi:hypothetical protein
MRVLNVVVGAGPWTLGLRRAVFAVGVLWLCGCGRAKSEARPGAPASTGGAAGSGAQNAGEGGHEDGAVGGSAGSGGGSNGGRAGGSGATSGAGGGANGGAGGAASAGASGSGAQGGDGGKSPLADLPLPAGCEAQSGTTTGLLCTLDVSCNAVAQTTRCYHSTSGSWQCTCEPPNASKTYLIDGAMGLDACAVAAGLCAGSSPDPGVILGGCVTTREEVGSDVGNPTCTLELQCERPVAVDFAPGVSVTMPGAGVTHCVQTLSEDQGSGPRRLSCETTGSLGSQADEIVANSVAEACRPVLELYLRAQEPEFDGSEACIVQDDDGGTADGCRLIETCFDSAPIGDGVSVVGARSETAASCMFDDLDNLLCGCRFESAGGEVKSFSYDLGLATRPAACDLSDCTLEIRAEAAGAGVCQAQEGSIQLEGDDVCKGYFSCSQAATLAGEDVTIYSQLNAYCTRVEDDGFYCGCAAGDETATYRAGEMATSSDACESARTVCLTHLALPLGPALSAALPPDPRPTP